MTHDWYLKRQFCRFLYFCGSRLTAKNVLCWRPLPHRTFSAFCFENALTSLFFRSGSFDSGSVSAAVIQVTSSYSITFFRFQLTAFTALTCSDFSSFIRYSVEPAKFGAWRWLCRFSKFNFLTVVWEKSNCHFLHVAFYSWHVQILL